MLFGSVARTGLGFFCLMLVFMACRNNFLTLGIVTLGTSLVSSIAVLVTGFFLCNYVLKLVSCFDYEVACFYLSVSFLNLYE